MIAPSFARLQNYQVDRRGDIKLKVIRPLRWLRVVGIALLPVVGAALFAIVMSVSGMTRYDTVYFTEVYQQRYVSPGVVVQALQEALQNGDNKLYAELTGLRHPSPSLQANPNISFVMLLEIDRAHYYHYLFFDEKKMTRATYHVKEVKGRWVVVPEDSFFYYDSGRWLAIFLPLAGVWWGIWIIVWLVQFLYDLGARYRKRHLDKL